MRDITIQMVFFLYGIILALVGSSLQAVGLCIWKLHSVSSSPNLSTDKVDLQETHATPLLPIELKKNREKNNFIFLDNNIPWIWIAGLCSFAIGNVCDFVALGISPLSVVTLIGSWSLVVSTFLANIFANEVVSKYDIASIMFIICGIILTVIGSDHRPNEWPLPRLIKHYEEPKVIVLLAILASIVAAGLIAIQLDFVSRKTRVSLDNPHVIERPGKTIRALYVIVGSVVGNFTALFGKAFAGLLVFTFSGQDQFNNPFVVMIILVFVVSLPLQIYLINASLAVNDILYHIPNFYVFWNVGNILTGAIFYEETEHFSGSNWALYLVGVLLLFGGVLCTNIATARKLQSTTSS